MLDLLIESFQYSFMQKALISGVFISIASALLGVFLVLRRFSLLSDGLSHVTFSTIAIALFAGINPLYISVPLVILASFVIMKLSTVSNSYADTAIGLVSTFSLALGVIVISAGKGFNLDIYSYLFGSILAIERYEVVVAVILSVVVIVVSLLKYNVWFLISFDRNYASTKRLGIFSNDLIFIILQSLVIVIGVKIVGAMLMSSLIIFPSVSSLQLARSFRSMILIAAVISLFSVICGILLSFMLNSPTGATIVIVNAFIFICAFFWGKFAFRR